MGLPEEAHEAIALMGANVLADLKNIIALAQASGLSFSLISYFQTYIQILIMTEGDQGLLTISLLNF